MFHLRGPFDELPFFLRVVGEHFGSEWYLAGAPRRNVAILFGHHHYATTKQDNEVRHFLTFEDRMPKYRRQDARKWGFLRMN
jgi:hypothetical protein